MIERKRNPSRPPLGLELERDRRRLRFGEFELATVTGELFRRDQSSRLRPVKLQPQPARALVYLAERPGKLLSRRRLQRHLWGEDYFVDQEQGLNYCIREIRKALGESAESPVFIQTLPRRGYRFVCAVEARNGSGDRRPGRGRLPSGTLLIAVIGAVLALLLLRSAGRSSDVPI